MKIRTVIDTDEVKLFLIISLAIIFIVGFLLWGLGFLRMEFFAGALIGFFAGIAGDITAGLLLSLDHFSSSTAGYRVKTIVKATREIIGSTNRSRLRDRYRYSLGVIMDKLESSWKPNEAFRENEWPCLVDSECFDDENRDRWELFNKYVRPVIEDTSGFTFIGWYGFVRVLCKKIRQLNALVKLCIRLETIVCELDAALEKDSLIELGKDDEDVIRPKTDSDPGEIKQLRDAYKKLHTAWQEWLRVCDVAG